VRRGGPADAGRLRSHRPRGDRGPRRRPGRAARPGGELPVGVRGVQRRHAGRTPDGAAHLAAAQRLGQRSVPRVRQAVGLQCLLADRHRHLLHRGGVRVRRSQRAARERVHLLRGHRGRGQRPRNVQRVRRRGVRAGQHPPGRAGGRNAGGAGRRRVPSVDGQRQRRQRGPLHGVPHPAAGAGRDVPGGRDRRARLSGRAGAERVRVRLPRGGGRHAGPREQPERADAGGSAPGLHRRADLRARRRPHAERLPLRDERDAEPRRRGHVHQRALPPGVRCRRVAAGAAERRAGGGVRPHHGAHLRPRRRRRVHRGQGRSDDGVQQRAHRRDARVQLRVPRARRERAGAPRRGSRAAAGQQPGRARPDDLRLGVPADPQRAAAERGPAV
ncbi:MAG: hypothetical protein AVDCRST_MAG89-1196, partial [uncultured Gemmatimonadetes bacterium]